MNSNKTILTLSLGLASLVFLSSVVFLKAEKKAQGTEVKKSGFQIKTADQVPTIPVQKVAGIQTTPALEEKQAPVEKGSCRNVPIFIYHHIGDEQGSLWDKTALFAQQMDYLAQKGYTTVTLVDVMESLKNEKDLPAKPVVLTFDDGYRDFYTNAYPILKAHNFKATVFIISQLMDGDAYLTWGQTAEMASSGLVTIGDHTLSHRSIPNLSPDEVKNEIISAQNIIQERLGIKVNVFAYPYGGASAEGEKVLREGGFEAAVTTKRGVTSCAGLPYEMPRIRVGNAPLSSYGF